MSFLSGAQNFGAASYVQSLKKKEKKRGVQLVPYCTWDNAVESNCKYSILLGGTKKAIKTGAVRLPGHQACIHIKLLKRGYN